MAQVLQKRPATPTIKQTRLLIDNQWVDPVEGGRLVHLELSCERQTGAMAITGEADFLLPG